MNFYSTAFAPRGNFYKSNELLILICVSLRPEANGGYGIFIFTDKYAGRDVALPASRFWNCGIALCFRAG